MLYYLFIRFINANFQIAKHTTPMYRAPEMLDLYQNYPINELSDIWVRKPIIPIKTPLLIQHHL